MKISTRLALSFASILILLTGFAFYSSYLSQTLGKINSETTQMALISSSINQLKALESEYAYDNKQSQYLAIQQLLADIESDLGSLNHNYLNKSNGNQLQLISELVQKNGRSFSDYTQLVNQNYALAMNTDEIKNEFSIVFMNFINSPIFDSYPLSQELLSLVLTSMNTIGPALVGINFEQQNVTFNDLDRIIYLAKDLETLPDFQSQLIGHRIKVQTTSLKENIAKYMNNQTLKLTYEKQMVTSLDTTIDLFNQIVIDQQDYSKTTAKSINIAYRLLIYVVILLSLIIVIAMSRSITHDLSRLMSVTSSIAQGNYQVRITNPKKDEIGRLSTSINTMAHELEEQTNSLKLYSEDLENIIADKTKELMAVQKELIDSNAQLVVDKELLLNLSTLDSLTHLKNHGYLIDALNERVKEARRYRIPFSILMLDIDNFKKINDHFGHQVGDEVLCAIADILVSLTRNCDIVSRYGGEEFVILFVETPLINALISSERIREAVSRLTFGPSELQVTISGGLTEYNEDSPNGILKRADDLLYQAKDRGRNQIIKG